LRLENHAFGTYRAALAKAYIISFALVFAIWVFLCETYVSIDPM